MGCFRLSMACALSRDSKAERIVRQRPHNAPRIAPSGAVAGSAACLAPLLEARGRTGVAPEKPSCRLRRRQGTRNGGRVSSAIKTGVPSIPGDSTGTIGEIKCAEVVQAKQRMKCSKTLAVHSFRSLLQTTANSENHPKTLFHGDNMGSNPIGDTNNP
jgi:hypothetical protein